MTLAMDPAKSSPKQSRGRVSAPDAPSAEALLAQALVGSSAPTANASDADFPQKRPFDWADSVIMSTADSKAPAAPSGTNDLLADIVADHLARATPADDATTAVAEPAPVATPDPSASAAPAADLPAVDAEDAIKSLQSEIDSLLAGTPHPSAPIEPAPSTPAPAEKNILADAAAEAISAGEKEQLNALEQAERNLDLTGGSISAEELDALLSKAELPRSDAPAEPVTPLPPDTIEAKVNEADGVLAEELAQLMAQSPATPAHEEAATTSAAPMAETQASEPSATAVATPPSDPAPQEAAATEPTRITETPTNAPAAPAPSTVAASTAEATPEAPRVMPEPIIEKEIAVEVAPAKSGRAGRLMHDIALMTAQAVDLPFRWINEWDKHIIGVAAFLLLLGGAVLYVVSLFVK